MESNEIEHARLELSRAQHELQREKLEADIANARASYDLQREKFDVEKSRPWYTASLPWLAPTLGALVAIGTIFLNQKFERASRERAAELENETLRFNRESQIILQATDGVTAAQAVRNLAFYLEAGFIEDTEGRIAAMVAAAEAPVTNAPRDVTFTPCEFDTSMVREDLSISSHRFEQIAQCQTPNTSGQELADGAARYIVVDFTASGSLESHVAWLQSASAQASAHIVIGRDGTIVQLVPFNMQAWHAGRSEWNGLDGLNRYSLGVSLINWGELRRSNGDRWRSYAGAEVDDVEILEATAWQSYPDAQISALLSVLRVLVQEYGIPVENIVGQADISPGRKNGPGPHFDWEFLRSKIEAN